MSNFVSSLGGSLSSKGTSSTGFAGLRENIGSTLRSLPRHQSNAISYWEALTENQKKVVLAGACSVGLVFVGLSVRKLVNSCWKKPTKPAVTVDTPSTLRSDLLKEAIDIAQEVVRHERLQLQKTTQETQEMKKPSKSHVLPEKHAVEPRRISPGRDDTLVSASSASVATGPFGDAHLGEKAQLYGVVAGGEEEQQVINKDGRSAAGEGDAPPAIKTQKRLSTSLRRRSSNKIKVSPLEETTLPEVKVPTCPSSPLLRPPSMNIPTAKSDIRCDVSFREDRADSLRTRMSFPSIKGTNWAFNKTNLTLQPTAAPRKSLMKPEEQLTSFHPTDPEEAFFAFSATRTKEAFLECGIEWPFPAEDTSHPSIEQQVEKFETKAQEVVFSPVSAEAPLSNNSEDHPEESHLDAKNVHVPTCSLSVDIARENDSGSADRMGLTDMSCLAGTEIPHDTCSARKSCDIDEEPLKLRLTAMLSQQNSLIEKDHMCPTETYTYSERLESDMQQLLAASGSPSEHEKSQQESLAAGPKEETVDADFSLACEFDAGIPDLEEELQALEAKLSDMKLKLSESLIIRSKADGARMGEFEPNVQQPVHVSVVSVPDSPPPIYFDRGDYCEPRPLPSEKPVDDWLEVYKPTQAKTEDEVMAVEEKSQSIHAVSHSLANGMEQETFEPVPTSQKSHLSITLSSVGKMDPCVPQKEYRKCMASSFAPPIIPPRRSKSLPLCVNGTGVLFGCVRLPEKAVSAENITEESRWRSSLDEKRTESLLIGLAPLKQAEEQLNQQLALVDGLALEERDIISKGRQFHSDKEDLKLPTLMNIKKIGAIHVIDPDIEDLYFDAATVSNTPKLSSLSMFQSRQAIRILTDKVRKLENVLGTEKCTRKVIDEVEDLKVALDTLRVAFASAGFPVDPDAWQFGFNRKGDSRYRSTPSVSVHASPKKRRHSADDVADPRESSCGSNTLIDVENLLHQSVVHEFKCHELKYILREHEKGFQRKKYLGRLCMQASDDGSNTTNDTMLSTSYLCSDTIDPHVEEGRASELPVAADEDLIQQPGHQKLLPQMSPFQTSDTLLDASPLDYDSDPKRTLGLLKLHADVCEQGSTAMLEPVNAADEDRVPIASESIELLAIAESRSSLALKQELKTSTPEDQVNPSSAAAEDFALRCESKERERLLMKMQVNTEEMKDPEMEVHAPAEESEAEENHVSIEAEFCGDAMAAVTDGNLPVAAEPITALAQEFPALAVTIPPPETGDEVHDDVTATVANDHVEANTEGFYVQDPSRALANLSRIKQQNIVTLPVAEMEALVDEHEKQRVIGSEQRKPAVEAPSTITPPPAEAGDGSSGVRKPSAGIQTPGPPKGRPNPQTAAKQVADEGPKNKPPATAKPKPGGPERRSSPARVKETQNPRPPGVPRQMTAAAHVTQSRVAARNDASRVSLISVSKAQAALQQQVKGKPETPLNRQGTAINRKPPGKTVPTIANPPAKPGAASPAKKVGKKAPPTLAAKARRTNK